MLGTQKTRTIRATRSDAIFDIVNRILMYLVLLIVAYPLIYVVAASFSDARAVVSGKVWLWPVNPTLDGYRAIFENPHVWTAYGNSIFYVVAGTAINLVVTICAAYPLSRRTFSGRRAFMLLFTFTMLFNAGMIPNYLLIKDLHLINTRWAMLLPGAMSVFNAIVMRTFFETTVPDEMIQAAQIDGCNEFRIMLQIVLPVSGAVIAVITLFCAVGIWNAYFDALLYLNKQALFPLQIVLRDILIQNQTATSTPSLEMVNQAELFNYQELIKYALIVVSSVPVLIIYPFVQKYFVQGVMIGAVKG